MQEAYELLEHYRRIALEATVLIRQAGYIDVATDFQEQFEQLAFPTETMAGFLSALNIIHFMIAAMITICETFGDLGHVQPYIEQNWTIKRHPTN